MKNKYKMTTLFLATALALSCGKDKIIPDVYPDYSIVDGDTVKTRIEKDYKKIKELDILSPKYFIVGDTVVTYKQVILHTPPSKAPDLSKIKNNDNPELKGKPLRYIAVGGSLTAGVRDGGYFNEGIQTSYPALVARQMGLQKFEQPLFDAADYNGYGRKAISGLNYTGGPVPKFKIVKNNSGVTQVSASGIDMRRYNGTVDNYAVMNLLTGNTILTPVNTPVNTVFSTLPYKEFFRRFFKDTNKSLSDQILSENVDVISFETGWQEVWNAYVNKIPQSAGTKFYPNGINNLNSENVYTLGVAVPLHGMMTFLKKLDESKKVKYGFFLNLPSFAELPFFNIVSKDQLNKAISISNQNLIYRENVKVLPTSEIDSLLGAKVNIVLKKGLTIDKPLSKFSILTEDEQIGMQAYINGLNKETESLSKSFGFPIVDINSLYRSIINGTFITDDGVKVDGSYPHGNFFSSDAIYPTAFGQAVIANEVIKVLNRYYKTEIPLINTKEYLLK